MPKYAIEMCRVSYAHATIELEAPDALTAGALAEDRAGNCDYNEHTAEYEIQAITRIPSKTVA
jgi:hypothetical protein